MSGVPGWRPWLAVTGIALSLMLFPVLAGIWLSVFDGDAVDPATLGFRGGEVMLETAFWSLGLGAIAVPLALIPGSRLARWADRGRGLVVAAWLVPLLLPPALLFDAWWIQVGPDSWIGRLAGESDRVPLLRRAVLALGLLGTAVPLSAWLLAALRHPAVESDRMLLLQDRPGMRSLVVAWLRRHRWPMVIAWITTSGIIAGLTVPFDLAQVRSWGFELRTLDTRGASGGTLLRVGSLGIGVAMVASLAMLRIGSFGDRDGRTSAAGVMRTATPGDRLTGVLSLFIWSLLVGGPLVMLVRRAASQDLATTWALHSEAAGGTATLMIGGGLLGAIVTIGFTIFRAGSHESRAAWGWKWLIPVLGLVAFMPATLVAIGVESAWRSSWLDPMVEGPIPTILAVAVRTAIVPALIGSVLGASIGVLPRLDAPRGIRDGWRAVRPVLLVALTTGFLVGGTLAAGEIPVTARVRPPGFPTLTGTLLDAMHYQYADSVLPVVVFLLAAAGFASVSLVRMARTVRRTTITSGVLVLVMVVPFGCARPDDSSESRPVDHRLWFGRPGNIDGRFDYPRAIALDEARGRVYVVDKSARVQRFSLEGDLETWWRMPAFENGKPTGIAVDDQGRVLVADTHEHRIAVFSPEGELLESHGGLGTAPGEFIYPTDVARGPRGTWFVSEYGGNDRVQIFDADWRPVGSIGTFGDAAYEAGEDFFLARPQSLSWNDARGELYIADAVNHRIVVTDGSGRRLRTLGRAGLKPGMLSYPYDLAVESEGTLLVVEFGNNRIQRLDVEDGRSLGTWGGTGTEPGRLRYPWGLDAGEESMVILDSGNSRVLVGDRP